MRQVFNCFGKSLKHHHFGLVMGLFILLYFGPKKADSLVKVSAKECDSYNLQITFDEFYALIRQKTLISW